MSDINRVLKGYNPKSNKRRYYASDFILRLLSILRLRILKR